MEINEIEKINDREHIDEKGRRYYFYLEHPNDKIWWVDYIDWTGILAVSFDKKKIYNLRTDYPDKFTPEEKELFDKENPHLAESLIWDKENGIKILELEKIRDDEILEGEEDLLKDDGKDIELIYDDEEHVDEEGRRYYFCLEHPDDKVWWVDYIGWIGYLAVSFDKKKIYNLYTDYPDKFTPEEKELFDRENPYWAAELGGKKEK